MAGIYKREPWPWPRVLDFARRHGMAAARFRDHQVIDAYWPPRWVDGELVRGGGRDG